MSWSREESSKYSYGRRRGSHIDNRHDRRDDVYNTDSHRRFQSSSDPYLADRRYDREDSRPQYEGDWRYTNRSDRGNRNQYRTGQRKDRQRPGREGNVHSDRYPDSDHSRQTATKADRGSHYDHDVLRWGHSTSGYSSQPEFQRRKGYNYGREADRYARYSQDVKYNTPYSPQSSSQGNKITFDYQHKSSFDDKEDHKIYQGSYARNPKQVQSSEPELCHTLSDTDYSKTSVGEKLNIDEGLDVYSVVKTAPVDTADSRLKDSSVETPVCLDTTASHSVFKNVYSGVTEIHLDNKTINVSIAPVQMETSQMKSQAPDISYLNQQMQDTKVNISNILNQLQTKLKPNVADCVNAIKSYKTDTANIPNVSDMGNAGSGVGGILEGSMRNMTAFMQKAEPVEKNSQISKEKMQEKFKRLWESEAANKDKKPNHMEENEKMRHEFQRLWEMNETKTYNVMSVDLDDKHKSIEDHNEAINSKDRGISLGEKKHDINEDSARYDFDGQLKSANIQYQKSLSKKIVRGNNQDSRQVRHDIKSDEKSNNFDGKHRQTTSFEGGNYYGARQKHDKERWRGETQSDKYNVDNTKQKERSGRHRSKNYGQQCYNEKPHENNEKGLFSEGSKSIDLSRNQNVLKPSHQYVKGSGALKEDHHKERICKTEEKGTHEKTDERNSIHSLSAGDINKEKGVNKKSLKDFKIPKIRKNPAETQDQGQQRNEELEHNEKSSEYSHISKVKKERLESNNQSSRGSDNQSVKRVSSKQSNIFEKMAFEQISTKTEVGGKHSSNANETKVVKKSLSSHKEDSSSSDSNSSGIFDKIEHFLNKDRSKSKKESERQSSKEIVSTTKKKEMTGKQSTSRESGDKNPSGNSKTNTVCDNSKAVQLSMCNDGEQYPGVKNLKNVNGQLYMENVKIYQPKPMLRFMTNVDIINSKLEIKENHASSKYKRIKKIDESSDSSSSECNVPSFIHKKTIVPVISESDLSDDLQDGIYMEIGSDEDISDEPKRSSPNSDPTEDEIGAAVAQSFKTEVEDDKKRNDGLQINMDISLEHCPQSSTISESRSLESSKDSKRAVCVVNLKIEDEDEEESQSILDVKPRCQTSNNQVQKQTEIKTVDILHSLGNEKIKNVKDFDNAEKVDDCKYKDKSVIATVPENSECSQERESFSDDDLPVIKRPKLIPRTRVICRKSRSEVKNNSNEKEAHLTQEIEPTNKIAGQITPVKKRLFKSSKPLSTNLTEETEHDGDVEDNLNIFDEPTQRYADGEALPESCNDLKDFDQAATQQSSWSQSENEAKVNLVIKEEDQKLLKDNESDIENQMVKEEPNWLKNGYTQEPDTVFISDDDIDMVMSVSQPIISLDSSESEQETVGNKNSVMIKTEKDDLANSEILDPDFWAFSSPEYDSAKGSDGDDFEPERFFNMVSRLSDPKQIDTDEERDDNLSDNDLYVFSDYDDDVDGLLIETQTEKMTEGETEKEVASVMSLSAAEGNKVNKSKSKYDAKTQSHTTGCQSQENKPQHSQTQLTQNMDVYMQDTQVDFELEENDSNQISALDFKSQFFSDKSDESTDNDLKYETSKDWHEKLEGNVDEEDIRKLSDRSDIFIEDMDDDITIESSMSDGSDIAVIESMNEFFNCPTQTFIDDKQDDIEKKHVNDKGDKNAEGSKTSIGHSGSNRTGIKGMDEYESKTQTFNADDDRLEDYTFETQIDDEIEHISSSHNPVNQRNYENDTQLFDHKNDLDVYAMETQVDSLEQERQHKVVREATENIDLCETQMIDCGDPVKEYNAQTQIDEDSHEISSDDGKADIHAICETEVIDSGDDLLEDYNAQTQIDKDVFEISSDDDKTDIHETAYKTKVSERTVVNKNNDIYTMETQVENITSDQNVFELSTQVGDQSSENIQENNGLLMQKSAGNDKTSYKDPQYELYLQKPNCGSSANLNEKLGIKVDHSFNEENSKMMFLDDDVYVTEEAEITAGKNDDIYFVPTQLTSEMSEFARDCHKEEYMTPTQVVSSGLSETDDDFADPYQTLTQIDEDDNHATGGNKDLKGNESAFDLLTQIDNFDEETKNAEGFSNVNNRMTNEESQLSEDTYHGRKDSGKTENSLAKRPYSSLQQEVSRVDNVSTATCQTQNSDGQINPAKKMKLNVNEKQSMEVDESIKVHVKPVVLERTSSKGPGKLSVQARQSIMIDAIPPKPFISSAQNVPQPRNKSFLDAHKKILVSEASKDDMWLSKKVSKDKGKMRTEKRKRNKSDDSAVDFKARITEARLKLEERKMMIIANPDRAPDPSKKLKSVSSMTSTIDQCQDVDYPSLSQVIDKGYPILDQSALLQPKKSNDSTTVNSVSQSEVTTSTATMVTSTVSVVTSSISTTVASNIHRSIPSTTVSSSNFNKHDGEKTDSKSDKPKSTAEQSKDRDKSSSNKTDEHRSNSHKHKHKKHKSKHRSEKESDKKHEKSSRKYESSDGSKPDDRSSSKSDKSTSDSKTNKYSSHTSSNKNRDQKSDKRDSIKKDTKYKSHEEGIQKHGHSEDKTYKHSRDHSKSSSSKHSEKKKSNMSVSETSDKQERKVAKDKHKNSIPLADKKEGSKDKQSASSSNNTVKETPEQKILLENAVGDQTEKAKLPVYKSSKNHETLKIKDVKETAEQKKHQENVSIDRSDKQKFPVVKSSEKQQACSEKVAKPFRDLSNSFKPSVRNSGKVPHEKVLGHTSNVNENHTSASSSTDKECEKIHQSCLSSKTSSVAQKRKRTVTWGDNTVHVNKMAKDVPSRANNFPVTSAESLMKKIPLGPTITPLQTEPYPPDLMKVVNPVTWEMVITQILKWNPAWFEERDKMETAGNKKCPSPPVTEDLDGRGSSGLFPLVDRYASLEEYINKFMLPLLMHETWQTIYTDWRERKNKSQMGKLYFLLNHHLNHGDKLQEYKFIGLMTREERRQWSNLNEGDLITLRIHGTEKIPGKCHNINKYILAVVVCVSFRDNRSDVERICSQNNELAKLRRPDSAGVLLTVRVRRRQFTPFGIPLTEIQPVSSIVSTKRQIDALDYFSKSPLCKDLLFPTANSTYSDRAVASLPHDRKKLNESQSVAVNTAVKIVGRVTAPVPRVCLLQGPPGTGKSYTIVNIIRRIVQEKKDKCCICLTAPSHAAVDELLRKLHRINSDTANPHYKIKMVRLGKKHCIHPDVQCYGIDQLVQRRLREDVPQSLLAERQNLETKMTAVMDNIKSTKDRLQIQKWTTDLNRLKKDKENLEAKVKNNITQFNPGKEKRAKSEILNGAHVIAGTLSSMGSNFLKTFLSKSRLFDCVILDEATQATELDSLIPLQYGASKLILVGDPEQLCPTVLSQVAQENKFNMSLFQRLDSHFRYSKVAANPIIFLDTQYRMDKEIASFPNNYIYEGKLKSDSGHKDTSLVPYLLYDIREGEEQFSQGSRSMSNQMEAMFTSELCKVILKETKFVENSIGIIAPYSKQKDEVRKQLASRGMKHIEVSTVDGFQGREKHIVIMSCVRAVSGSLGFVGNRNRMNVALTRAKYAMYLVGHFGALESSDEWKALIDDAKHRNKIVTVSVDSYQQDILCCLKNKDYRP